MPGAPSSNRCGTCKSRKVKCDEAWPVCGPCKKGNRFCPGRPVTQIRFVDDLPGLPVRSASHTRQEHAPHVSAAAASGQSNSARYLQMITLRHTSKEGGSFQKIRLLDVGENSAAASQTLGSPSFRSPSYSSSEDLARRLYAFIDSGHHGAGAGVHIHGMWLRELPRRFGTSAALDDAVLCLVSSHEAVVRGDSHLTWLNSQQYGTALKSLQKAVDSPRDQFSTDTLAAVSIMWRIEGIFAAANSTISRQCVHARALAHMLQVRGSRVSADKLECLLALECQIAAVQSCIASDFPQPCVFEAEEWDIIYDRPNGRSELCILYWRVFREFVRWPGMMHDILMIHMYPGKATSTIEDVARRAILFATNIEKVGHDIEAALKDPKVCITKPSSVGDPLVPIVFDFRDTEAAPLLGYYCLCCIIANRMLIHLSSQLSPETRDDPSIPLDLPNTFPLSAEYDIPHNLFSDTSLDWFPLSKPFIRNLQLRNVQAAQTVWMMYEQARSWKPVGCLFFINALKASYPWASPEMKSWILNAAADIEDWLPYRTGWDPEKLERMGRVMSGEIQGEDENF